ncbi:chromate transporter [Ideonella alba]|uniref:Chromate transporter n=1 Tax=Ideonella alba TaxID=2824118 RepID=A0A941BDM5_9BURK|nr:chromate transporter [Ideonella alba]MBQ0929072.1 chromate transporter [Ideonella alba]
MSGPLQRPAHLGELFLVFTGLALQGFGGVLGVVHRELVERRAWMDEAGFAGDWATAQVLPGPNVCNLALMYGWRQFGWRGALSALGGLLLAPTLLLVLLATALAQVESWPVVKGAIAGLSALAAGLVAGAGLRLAAGLSAHPLGRAPALALAALALATLLLGLPMVGVVLLVGLPACGLTWRCLRPPR